MAAGDDSVRSLEHTPTWAVAVVCFIIISISITMEHSIHLLANWFKKRNKTALFGALEKLKSELMLLGFISLFLTVTQEYIAKICIPTSAGDTMLPCRKQDANSDSAELNHFVKKFSHTIRQLLAEEEDSTEDGDSCTAKGKVALISEDGIHQLHIFIFVLALMQIVYSTLTMGLGRAKMRRWKVWEKETQTTEYIVANDPNRFRFTRQTTFGRRHMNNFTETVVHLWIKSFFRQFYKSVAKVDYLTLRHGFIAAHFSGRHNSFNFQQYIQRSLEEDFSVVVGVSPLMWFLVVILLLVDVHDWYVYSWLSFVPLLISLAIGSKLGVIVARMALQIKDQNNVIIGTPLVKPNDDLFWFGKPKFVLTLIHYILFVNAYEVAFVIWVIVSSLS
ncbi:MLO-like protein 3 [Morus notabilis]|uniref:MLO-like protein 3 n=1 Tax=Morus notabilis TaxID=981085 RepID=UPI000CED377B|nr:MLO-like protein 3 [Morus notabilis]